MSTRYFLPQLASCFPIVKVAVIETFKRQAYGYRESEAYVSRIAYFAGAVPGFQCIAPCFENRGAITAIVVPAVRPMKDTTSHVAMIGCRLRVGLLRLSQKEIARDQTVQWGTGLKVYGES